MTATTLLRFTSLLACVTLLFGCVTTADDSSRTITESTIAGATLGGLLGGTIADKSEWAEGTALGGAIGGGIGYLVGLEIAKRKNEYKTAEDFYDAQIRIADKYSEELRIASANLKRENQARLAQIERLKQEYRAGKLNRDRALALRANMAKERKKVERLIATTGKEIEVQEGVVAELRETEGASNHRTLQLQKKVDTMRQRNGELQKGIQVMADYDASLERVI